MLKIKQLKLKTSSIIALALLFSFPTSSYASSDKNSYAAIKPIALIYDGPGACKEDCAEAAASIAVAAGFTAKIVHADQTGEKIDEKTLSEIFSSASVWIQPGGGAHTAYEAMAPQFREHLIAFVKRGGGYVGFCAGAFIATAKIGSLKTSGLGIFPGSTVPYYPPTAKPGVVFSFEKLMWKGEPRTMYFEEGPYFADLEKNPSVEIIAKYKDGKIAAARSTFGKGKVFLSGPHPEAPTWWSESDGVHDEDGSDYIFAVNMVRWVANLNPMTDVKNLSGVLGNDHPVALIYRGPGVCKEDCAEAAGEAAFEAGYTPKYVNENSLSEKSSPEDKKLFFKNAKVWIQPGGVHEKELQAMNPVLIQSMKDFIKTGGGYVGFCAGAIAAADADIRGSKGFGIFPGKVPYFKAPSVGPKNGENKYSLETVKWNGKPVSIYFEEGPYLSELEDSSGKTIPGVEIVARFDRFHDGKIAAARSTYGQGRVFISGVHPEAPSSWYKQEGMSKDEAPVHFIAVDMIRWAGKMQHYSEPL